MMGSQTCSQSTWMYKLNHFWRFGVKACFSTAGLSSPPRHLCRCSAFIGYGFSPKQWHSARGRAGGRGQTAGLRAVLVNPMFDPNRARGWALNCVLTSRGEIHFWTVGEVIRRGRYLFRHLPGRLESMEKQGVNTMALFVLSLCHHRGMHTGLSALPSFSGLDSEEHIYNIIYIMRQEYSERLPRA